MNSSFRTAAGLVLMSCAIFMVGCAGPAPNYSPSIANVEALKKGNIVASNVGSITVAASVQGGTSVRLRANTMESPIGSNFGDYIANALRQELELAKLIDANSSTVVSGELFRNEMDSAGISTGEGQIEARFLVKRDGQIRFDKVKRADHKWESSFVGGIAIPNAIRAYPELVQKLITALVADAEFVNALKK